MEAYSDFASVYDTFMDQTPYDKWSMKIREKLKEYGIASGIILDIGCGTGTLTIMMQKLGYDMIGIDNSCEMLQIATEKWRSEKESDKNICGDILYVEQDMTKLELYGTVAAAISVCDSINYLLNIDDVIETFRHVNNYLDPDGIFIFDFNTEYKYREVIGDSVIAENRDTCSFIWENYYYEDEKINEYDLTIFVQEEGTRYRKFTETHYQKGYTLEEIQDAIKKSGMKFMEAFDGDTYKEVTPKSERIQLIVKRSEEEG